LTTNQQLGIAIQCYVRTRQSYLFLVLEPAGSLRPVLRTADHRSYQYNSVTSWPHGGASRHVGTGNL